MKNKGFILLFLILLLPKISAQEVSVTAAFDSSSLYIGDQTWFRVRVEKPASWLLSVQKLNDTLAGGLIILAGPVGDTANLKSGRIVINHNYLVTAFDSGRYEVKPVSASMLSEGREIRYFSDYTFIDFKRVNITPPDSTTKFFDIIKPYSAPLRVNDVLPWILGLSLAGILAWLIAKKVKEHLKGKTIIEKEISSDPPHLIALRELERLSEENLWQKGDIKEYHSRLSDILRSYIDRRFEIKAMELTTAETLQGLWRNGLKDEDILTRIRTILKGADLVKFAKYVPENSENESFMSMAIQFVDMTKAADNESVDGTDGREVK